MRVIECKYVSKVRGQLVLLVIVKTSKSCKAEEMVRRSISIFATGRLETTPLAYPRLRMWWQ